MYDLPGRIRPADFDEVLGQDAVVATLQAQLAKPSEKRNHVVLFHGATGCGKNTLAYIYAKALGGEVVEYNCSKMTGKDDADQITDTFQYLPTGGDHTVIILNEVSRLSKNAQESMLVPLEMCPQHIYVLACTSNVGLLKKDFVNRCLSVEVKPLGSRDATALIRRTLKSEGIELPKEAWTPIIEASEGSSRQILQNVEKVSGALASGSMLEDALALVTGATEDAPGVKELYKALCVGGRTLRDTLKELKSQDPEALRRGVGGYATAIWLSTGDEKPLRILQVMSSGNTYDCGFMGLVAMCSAVSEG